MKKKRRESHEWYKTRTCSVASVEQRINRFAEKGWTLSHLLPVGEERVLLVFRLDSFGDVTQLSTQLSQMQMQQYVDRHAKMVEILSNTLRKVSETNASIISNMK